MGCDGAETFFPPEQVRKIVFLPVSSEGQAINTYGAGDVNLETLKLKGWQGTLPALECIST